MVPPGTASFEAAARLVSFKSAARELNVTPAAVSHQIKALERELGVLLFRRQHRGVALTADGAALFETLAAAFGQISRQLSRIRQVADTDSVTVGSTTAVAALWLSPAIIRFWRENPEISVHQVTQDRPITSTSGFDFFISYGKASEPFLSQTPSYRDTLVPVTAPDLAGTLSGSSLADLAGQRLIHLNAANPSWTRWPEWFTALGYKGSLAVGTKVTSYSVALQIASQAAGVALGWRREGVELGLTLEGGGWILGLATPLAGGEAEDARPTLARYPGAFGVLALTVGWHRSLEGGVR